MYSMAVAEEPDGQIVAHIRARLERLGSGQGVVITRSEKLGALQDRYDLILIASEIARSVSFPTVHSVNCGVLLTPGQWASNTARAIHADCVVSFGMSGRDTITMSSVADGMPVLALQRELVTLGGDILERQELPIHYMGSASADTLLGVYGSLLILGLPAECLGVA